MILKRGDDSLRDKFWRNVYFIRGMLWTGEVASWELEWDGFTKQEIKTAIFLNNHCSNKERGLMF
ncbi:hypothetical protein LCGC14_1874010 [marine sediment metagenome]|uniref:Uncharacterized protein n=1 Tax=marine sediment metagenome TaxID=412755 RepID=A0A0F9II72_9ZZZZ